MKPFNKTLYIYCIIRCAWILTDEILASTMLSGTMFLIKIKDTYIDVRGKTG